MADDLVRRALALLKSYPVQPRVTGPIPTAPAVEPELPPVTSPSLVGHLVSINSPLFGLMQAIILEETERTVRIFHPITEREATIPKGWLEEKEGTE